MNTSDCETLAALLPTYTEQGDCVQFLYQNGSSEKVNHRLSTCLKRLARQYTIDIVALREAQQKQTVRRQQLPLPFSPHLVLIPLKIRKPRLPKDTTLGYINLFAVKEVLRLGPSLTQLELLGNHETTVLWSKNTVLRYLKQAELCRGPYFYYTTPLVFKLAEVVQEIFSLSHKL